jgi:broad specificity phosphatase PhoE
MSGSPSSASGHTRLLVVRHGRSEWNSQGRWQGHADIPLDDAGMHQAAAAAEVLGAFDAIWASDLQRATLTAQIIAELHGVGPVQIDPRLRETDVGPWEGLQAAEVEAGWPGFLADHRRPEGFEPYADAAARVLASLVDIAAAHRGGDVLVVSHGGVIRAVRRALDSPDPHMPNLSGSWFSVDPHGRVAAGEVVVLVDHSSSPSAPRPSTPPSDASEVQ